MIDWYVHLESHGEIDEDAIDDLLDALQPYGGVVSGGKGFQTFGMTFTVSAQSLATAARLAVVTFRRVSPIRPFRMRDLLALEIRRQADVAEENKRPTFPDLVGTAEIASILGVSKQRVWSLVNENKDFPLPIARIAAGPIWTRPAILTFLEDWKPRRHAGRPKTRPETD